MKNFGLLAQFSKYTMYNISNIMLDATNVYSFYLSLKIFLAHLTGMMVTWLYKFVKVHPTVYFKWVSLLYTL